MTLIAALVRCSLLGALSREALRSEETRYLGLRIYSHAVAVRRSVAS